MSKAKRVAVIGGGLAGLVAAYELRKAGVNVELFEFSGHVGGRTRSLSKGEFTFDTGALVMLPTYKNMVRLVNELGLQSQLQISKPQLGIVRGGGIHSFSYKQPIRSGLRLGLLTSRSKLKLLKLLPLLLRYWRRLNYDSMDALCELDNETVQSYCLRTLNKEIDDYLADPFIRINSLTGSDQAPTGEFIWLLHAYFSPYTYHLTQGMDSFAKALSRDLTIRLWSRVLSVKKNESGGVALQLEDEEDERHYDAGILALPPVNSKKLYRLSQSNDEIGYLNKIKPVKIISLHLGLNYRPDVKDALVLLPKCECEDLVSIIFEHNKGSGRAPEGKAAVTIQASIDWTAKNHHLSDDLIKDALLKAASPFVGDFSQCVEEYAVSCWDYVCPVTYPGYFTDLKEYRAQLAAEAPVFFAGDYFSGGMEGAVVSWCSSANEVIRSFSNISR